ncbi:MAG: S49 family peptidase [Gammaproteobacteria bacterium]|nr:S49 family peptidase [Gammaproteobacteria bacterium]
MNQHETESALEERAFHRDLINRLSFAALAEQRRSRRWGIFFKVLTFTYLIVVTVILFQGQQLQKLTASTTEHTALVEIKGVIAEDSRANAEDVIASLRDAFEDEGVKGVIVEINSPGGSPVQSAYIYDELRRLRQQNPEIPLHAVIADIGASGGYYIAVGAENIYVNPSSIIGSIGVRMDSFGFTESMKKLGVERRLYTAGVNKGGLDPFLPEKEGDVEHVKGVLTEVHQQFITAVKAGRGARLGQNPDLFSGLFWSGERGVALGLADGLGDRHFVAREIIGAKKIVSYTHTPDLLARFAERVGTALSQQLHQQWTAQLTLQ